MTETDRAAARGRRQERVANLVWGLLLIGTGALFTLHQLGRINLAEPSAFPARHAVDGDPGSRWSSAFSDPQWIALDLGAPVDVRSVQLRWEAAYAKAYEIQVSDDGARWTTAAQVTDGDGDVDEIELSARGRYVRLYGTLRSTPYGYSLWEFEAYGADGAPLPPSAATASSLEGAGAYWLRFLPLALVGLGLPLVLAPKDAANQVIGLVLTAVGALFQLRALRLTSWGFADLLPVLFILGGGLLLVQSLRGAGGRPSSQDEVGSPGSLQ